MIFPIKYDIFNLRLIRNFKKRKNMVYNTEQRTLLLNFLKEHPDTMFCAKQIEAAIQKDCISRSAVYRNLAELESEGKIKRCSKAGSREVYYQYFDSQSCKNHIHLFCKQCGKIFHMENKIADSIVNNVEQDNGFEINKGETTIYGVCRDCNTRSTK